MTVIISKDTTWTGNVVLDDQYQIAPGVTLTIAAGATVSAVDWRAEIQVFGTLQVAGTATNRVTFNGVSSLFGQKSQDGVINIDNADLINVWSIGNNGGHGTLRVTNSYLENSNIYAWYNNPGALISKNIFNSSEVTVYNYSGALDISNNLFFGSPGGNPANEYISLQAASSSVSVVGNSFLGSAPGIASKDLNRSGQTVYAEGNWFGSSDSTLINTKILDSSDNLTYGKVDYSHSLAAASPQTPTGYYFFGNDHYNPINQQLNISQVSAYGKNFSNVVITVANVLDVGSNAPKASIDSYDDIHNQLTIPSVEVVGTVYTNVLITVGQIISVG